MIMLMIIISCIALVSIMTFDIVINFVWLLNLNDWTGRPVGLDNVQLVLHLVKVVEESNISLFLFFAKLLPFLFDFANVCVGLDLELEHGQFEFLLDIRISLRIGQ